MFSFLLYSISDGVCRITLNRPEVYHALSPGLIHEIRDAVEAAGADESVRVIVLTASGDRAFSSGADLKEASEPIQAGERLSLGEKLRTTYHPMILAIRSVPKPVICRLNGLAAGAGCSLALSCDQVIMAEEAYLSLLFVGIGLMPDAGSTYFLPRLVGQQKAFELCATGRRVYGPEAERLGLVSRSVPSADLDKTVEELVSYYASAPTQAIGAMKLALNQSLTNSLEEQMEKEAQYQDLLGFTKDVAEGIGAFLTKRKAVFSGK
ncbi:enoyl-CoA hydratase/isomerase family protein [Larkinella soli]|uniref:enoyl-CoA hydratase/isomerase family protein n=1 Tax=Larkinella soli TaxID=1770527 RepID=UPI000FFB5FED|nr:enoyl-CoA hydratase-related protein [Larkinella soli]